MIPKEKVKELVAARAKLEDPMTGAIWIRREAAEAWLVEVIPSLRDDEHAAEPTYFSPGVEFRFPLALIAASRASFESALRTAPDLARDITAGEVLFDGGDAEYLLRVARALAPAA